MEILFKHGILFKVSVIFFILTLISYLNAFSSEITSSVFFSLTLLTLSMAKSKISLGKCHTALENIWVICNYLLILISNMIPQ